MVLSILDFTIMISWKNSVLYLFHLWRNCWFLLMLSRGDFSSFLFLFRQISSLSFLLSNYHPVMISYKYLSLYFATSECFPTFLSFQRRHRRFDSNCQTESYSCQVVLALVVKNEIWSSSLAKMKVPQNFVSFSKKLLFCMWITVLTQFCITSVFNFVFTWATFFFLILDGLCILGSNWMFSGYPQTLSVRNSPKIWSTFLGIFVMSILAEIYFYAKLSPIYILVWFCRLIFVLWNNFNKQFFQISPRRDKTVRGS